MILGRVTHLDAIRDTKAAPRIECLISQDFDLAVFLRPEAFLQRSICLAKSIGSYPYSNI